MGANSLFYVVETDNVGKRYYRFSFDQSIKIFLHSKALARGELLLTLVKTVVMTDISGLLYSCFLVLYI